MANVKELNEKVDKLLVQIDEERQQFTELVTTVRELKNTVYIPPELAAKLDLAIEKVGNIVDPTELDEPAPIEPVEEVAPPVEEPAATIDAAF